MSPGNEYEPLILPYAAAPEFGETLEIADGPLWLRPPLPYAPGHVNVYLIEDEDGWMAVDAGLFDAATCAIWDRLPARLPRKQRINRVRVTHWHPDHLGAAGWLCEKLGVPLAMSETRVFGVG